ncbi:hypothetical protein BDW22DRAFT_1216558 [Trametopsis cervina]|nr:hypothetical protein BDW22DRAFT_1216558 [Trametopsis cervina]
MPRFIPEVRTPETVAELNEALASGVVPDALLEQAEPFERRLIHVSLSLAGLRIIKYFYGVHSSSEARFRILRAPPVVPIPGTSSSAHLRKFRTVFASLNNQVGRIFGPKRVQHFLDLGCSPGGFSEWTLTNNPAARGMGITLPDSEASWPMNTTDTQLEGDRYELRFANIISLVAETETDELLFRPGQFDLVLAGAFPTFQRVTFVHRAQLVLSELVILLRNIKYGGNGVVLINNKPFRWIVEVVSILRRCFTEVRAEKGGRVHKERSSCYLVCTGFCATRDVRERFIGRLRSTLDILAAYAAEHSSLCLPEDELCRENDGHNFDDREVYRSAMPHMVIRIFDDISDDAVFEHEHEFFIAILEPVWNFQYKAIYTLLCDGLQQPIRRASGTSFPRFLTRSCRHVRAKYSCINPVAEDSEARD